MVARFGKGCILAALVISTGAHWAALQTVAWTTMLADNLRVYSVGEAVSRTFDGKHPCCLCRAIAAGKKSEKKKEYTLQIQKFEFPPFEEKFVVVAPSAFKLMPLTDLFTETRAEPPPPPPPRGLFA